ncbi:MAG: ABC transporter permease [Bacteroidota bacterium]
MLHNYLTIAWRNLLRHKVFSLINILGLAIGMAACLLILQYVSFELSFDSFHEKGDRIYRIRKDSWQNGVQLSKSATTDPALAPALKAELPEVVQATRIVHTSPFMTDPVMQHGNQSFFENRIYIVDPAFLQMFTLTFRHGNPTTALAQPQDILLSHSMANKYFGKENALGKTLVFHQGINGKRPVTVAGVFEDLPENSHFKPDFLVPFTSLPSNWNLDKNWDWGNFYTYVELAPGTHSTLVENKFPALLKKYLGDVVDVKKNGGYEGKLLLQPLKSIHLYSDLWAEMEVNGNGQAVWLLTIIAFFILLIAWINYINLSTAKATDRAREVGIRKVVGSGRAQIIKQFLLESFLLNLGAAALSITLFQFLLPFFRVFTGRPLASSFGNDPQLWLYAIILFLSGTLLSGFYPAIVVSAYQPIQVLKGKVRASTDGVWLRKGLVVFQFATSIALIVGTLTVKQQLAFMQNQDLGVNLDQTLILKGPAVRDSSYQRKFDYFKAVARQNPTVQQVAVSSNIPGQEVSWGRSFSRQTNQKDQQGINIIAIDEDFLPLYESKFLAGRNFSKDFSSDRDGIIFNGEAIRLLGFSSPEAAIGQVVIWYEGDNNSLPKRVIGVIKSYNQQSLKQEVVPLVFALKQYLDAPWAGEYYSIRLNTNHLPNTLEKLRGSWNEIFPGNPFDHFFLNDFFNAQYKTDIQFGKVFQLFSALAIFIACLGLFGLALFTTTQRTKEIGVRKVLGANISSIVLLLSKDFIQLVLIANLLSWPLAYWGISQWLENYAFRIEISPWLFILPTLLVLLIALLTVSFQTWRAARQNPVKALRYE